MGVADSVTRSGSSCMPTEHRAGVRAAVQAHRPAGRPGTLLLAFDRPRACQPASASEPEVPLLRTWSAACCSARERRRTASSSSEAAAIGYIRGRQLIRKLRILYDLPYMDTSMADADDVDRQEGFGKQPQEAEEVEEETFTLHVAIRRPTTTTQGRSTDV
uniref:Uncharacterized protein n=1 Tax=Leersia perrieri TaxID=77586 RepID=A0A0D9VS25_9ORYZ